MRRNQFVVGKSGEGMGMNRSDISEYSQAMAIARTFVKSGEREGFWGEYAIELLAGCMMYMQKKRGEPLFVDVKQTVDFLQKAKEQEEYITECVKSMEENHPSYHIFRILASSGYKIRNGVIDTLTAMLLEHGMHYKNTEFSESMNILISGGVGKGKTMVMKQFISYQNRISNKVTILDNDGEYRAYGEKVDTVEVICLSSQDSALLGVKERETCLHSDVVCIDEGNRWYAQNPEEFMELLEELQACGIKIIASFIEAPEAVQEVFDVRIDLDESAC
ncbi:type IV secretion system DNA-binding domain-containing protein [Bacillus cereus]|uniref:CpaF/VirB11 family protein n=2 Tax=Bacillus cereus group TaxID=86661 RepID=A0AAW5L3R2_BACCE|nr:type IV secretion system DNA-binding domain-containing protein [Bacillus cereus]MCQ6287867.1 CpaF/VirB11 family protein [Bacillus cereus]MCQ6315960.1 CpaF/VirB11 family protein [Bacillus cereus]MCQ6327836.1 CpaF/VirB11 family protein [Bacillus cereus]MCQ6384918.1 CpaF/VirB11 family protein [Bacillus cereus]